MSISRQYEKCENLEDCISDLVVPIFGKRTNEGTKSSDLNPDWLEEKMSGTECSRVPDTMSHLLWGPDWVNRKAEHKGEAYGNWDPLYYEAGEGIKDGHEIQLEWIDNLKPRLNCSKAVAEDICVSQATTLCTRFFNETITPFPSYEGLSREGSIAISLSFTVLMALQAIRGHYRMKANADDVAKIDKVEKEILGSIAKNIRWWDINFLEQEMEDAIRKNMHLEKLMEFRILIIVGLVVVFGYPISTRNSRVTIRWPHRIILAVYCCLVLPLTIRENFVKYQVLSELMFSNTMILVSVVFLMIAYLDKFEGTPTQSYLLMGLVFFFQIIIMFVTRIVWFRKMLINLFVVVAYSFIAMANRRQCFGRPEMTASGRGSFYATTNNSYPVLQLIPDYDTFKYNLSCNESSEEINFNLQILEVFLLWSLLARIGYKEEYKKRVDFFSYWKSASDDMDVKGNVGDKGDAKS